MADDAQQDATPSPDGQVGQGRTTEQPDDSTTKTDDEPQDEDVPSEYLGLDARNVQYITQIWKIEHQH